MGGQAQAGGAPWTNAAGWQQRASAAGDSGESRPAAASSCCRDEEGTAVEQTHTDAERPPRRQGERAKISPK